MSAARRLITHDFELTAGNYCERCLEWDGGQTREDDIGTFKETRGDGLNSESEGIVEAGDGVPWTGLRYRPLRSETWPLSPHREIFKYNGFSEQ
jgi:hypothetical protein